MTATAYASLVSLLNTVDQIHTHPLVSSFFDINQNRYLSEKVNLLVEFVEKYSDADIREVEDLVRRIGDAAHEAENIMEIHAADRVCGGENPSFLSDLQMIIEDMDSIKEEVIKIKGDDANSSSFLPDVPPSSSSSSSAPPPIDEATTMLGFDHYVDQLLDYLTGHNVDRSIISISGMGGIGKTTLAKSLYENSHTKSHFIVRVWITVSQEYSARAVYLQALSCLRGVSIDMDTADDQQLSVELYQSLFNRRYLIVLDDVWSVEIWDKIKLFFPENKNRSRIVVTTRESELVDYIGSSTVTMNFLNEENSWNLFCEKTFPQQTFPPKLEEVGKKIVEKCGGLPLAIIVIGGLLGQSPRTQEYWEKIAKDKSLILNPGDNKPSSILYLSYKYLPIYLKPCFLHFGLYPEDIYIDVSLIVPLWVAEGFIKANKGQSMEEVAENYINDLVDRNLLLPPQVSTSNLNFFSMHDLVRDLCIMIGEKENFYSVQRSIDANHHFVSDQITTRFYPQESHVSDTPSIFHPLIVHGKRTTPFRTRLLRVFCCDEGSPHPHYALQEVNMRFLRQFCSKEHEYLLPSLVSRLWGLQTIIVEANNVVVAPAEIWKMPHLRHIDFWKICLPDPPHCEDDIYVLQNLQTLKRVQNLIFTKEVCKRIPNLKELHIYCDFSSQSPCYHLENVVCFNKLESLHYSCKGLQYAGDLLQNIKFPSSLKELRLWNCQLEWSYMAVIASLPHLQLLYLDENSVAATEWGFVDEEFISLKNLVMIGSGDVTKWTAESFNFPVLEMLTIQHFWQLDEVPSGIGEIPTLQRIYLSCCSESANISGVEILHEQQRFGNLDIRLLIQFPDSSDDEATSFRDKIQQLDLTCQNLKIYCGPYVY